MCVTVLASAKQTVVFIQDELHDLVLEDHVHGDVRCLRLRPKQRWAEHDGDVLHSHPVALTVLNYPDIQRKNYKSPISPTTKIYLLQENRFPSKGKRLQLFHGSKLKEVKNKCPTF